MFRYMKPVLLDLPEIDERLVYYSKRAYRLRKLERMGKIVQPDLQECEKLEDELDIEGRERRRLMAEIAF